jgi:hypothetical protein
MERRLCGDDFRVEDVAAGGLLIASDAINRSRTATRPGMVERTSRGAQGSFLEQPVIAGAAVQDLDRE